MPRLNLLLVLAAAAALTGCGGPTPTPSHPTSVPTQSPPKCNGTTVDLGRPGAAARPARFTTSGGSLMIAASGFPHGGIGDPEVGATLVSLGTPQAEPSFDAAAGAIRNAAREVTVHEDRPAAIELVSGTYWLVSSNTVTIHVTPCPPTTLTQVLRP